jgi:hypothetical protein
MSSIEILNDVFFSFLDYPDPNNGCIVIPTPFCNHYCFGCQNEAIINNNAQNIVKYSLEEFKIYIQRKSLEYRTTNLVFGGGGDILSRESDVEFLKDFLSYNSNFSKFNICVYTGDIDFIVKEKFNNFPYNPTYWKCGIYYYKERQQPGKFYDKMIFASKNQKLLDSNFKCLSKNGIYYFDESLVGKLKRFLRKIKKEISWT